MLHDLLYAMCGHPGSIFKESFGKLEVLSALPQLSPNEKNALDHLLILGTKYMHFNKFLTLHLSPLSESALNGNELKQGCYLNAFCLGLDGVLFDYRDCILQLEKDVVADPFLSLLYIQQNTEKYHVVFDALIEVMKCITTRKSHGCQILSILHKFSCSGNPYVKEALLKIMSRCHIVLFKQLSSWILYGLLIDQYNEFFITCSVSATNSSRSSTDRSSVSSFENCTENFDVELSRLPSYIPLRIARMIRFIGSSLRLFECNKKWSMSDSSKISTGSNIVPPDFKAAEILQNNEEEYLRDLKQLQNAQELVVEKFEVCIEKVRSAVAKKLWKLCVEEGKLISHLNILKDFLLLGRGELFLVFIDEANSILKTPPSRVTEHDVQQLFLKSAAKVHIEDDLPLQHFHLTIQQDPNAGLRSFVSFSSVDDGWSRLGMTFRVKWPLQTIFTPSVMEKYNLLFTFLLKVKRTQIALQKIWTVQMQTQQTRDIGNDSLITPNSMPEGQTLEALLWQCRSQMQFFIDNLQYYLQADVLETHFTNLLHKIQETDEKFHDFERIILVHENFVNALMSQCFVMSGAVCSSLIEIMDLCQQFCDVVVTSSLLISRKDIYEQIIKLWNLFSKKSFVFFQVLSGVSSSQCNPHISQLTLRLDYNRHFSLNMKLKQQLP